MTTTIDVRPYKGREYAIYVDGACIFHGQLKRVLAIAKVLRKESV